ncbi:MULTISPECIES: DUF3093 family protein [Kitasatospora]|uniref:DUF3093 domain-containing protein n=1 Tax=Kitasatospora arboriphila TaxID=258052 RepID=A0ABN1TMA7_9ACTN
MVIYDERLSVPVRWWLAAAASAAGLAAALLPLGPMPAVAAGALLLAVTASVLRGYGAVRIRVCDGVLVAGQIVLRAEHFGGIEILDETEALAWRTRRAGPRARLLMRGFLPQAVRVDIVEPTLLCPFVYLSTRRPAELAGVLADARTRYGLHTAA